MSPTVEFALMVGAFFLAIIVLAFRRIEQLRLRLLISAPFFIIAAYFGYIVLFRSA